MIRVLVVDDQELVRAGCEMVVAAQPDMSVVGSVGDGASALRRLAEVPADVVLMDIRMPGGDGIDTTRRLLERPGHQPRVIMLTTFDLDEYVLAALHAGASGFVVKDAPAEDMLAAIRSVHRGDAALSPSSARRLLDHVATHLVVRPLGPDPLAPLTARERDVVRLLARGLSNARIARELHLAPGTVKVHVAAVLAKLGLADRIQVVIWAYENAVVHVGEQGGPPGAAGTRLSR